MLWNRHVPSRVLVCLELLTCLIYFTLGKYNVLSVSALISFHFNNRFQSLINSEQHLKINLFLKIWVGDPDHVSRVVELL